MKFMYQYSFKTPFEYKKQNYKNSAQVHKFKLNERKLYLKLNYLLKIQYIYSNF